MSPLDVAAFLIYFAQAFVEVLVWTLSALIIIRVILMWIPTVRLPMGLGDLVFSISESVLGPIRRVLPPMGGFDLSPLVALIGLRAVEEILLRILHSLFVAL
jgi:YggT family protein